MYVLRTYSSVQTLISLALDIIATHHTVNHACKPVADDYQVHVSQPSNLIISVVAHSLYEPYVLLRCTDTPAHSVFKLPVKAVPTALLFPAGRSSVFVDSIHIARIGHPGSGDSYIAKYLLHLVCACLSIVLFRLSFGSMLRVRSILVVFPVTTYIFTHTENLT